MTNTAISELDSLLLGEYQRGQTDGLEQGLAAARAFQQVARGYLAELKAAQRRLAELEPDSTAARQTMPAEIRPEVLELGADWCACHNRADCPCGGACDPTRTAERI
jgi:hypothetical protein